MTRQCRPLTRCSAGWTTFEVTAGSGKVVLPLRTATRLAGAENAQRAIAEDGGRRPSRDRDLTADRE